MSRPDQPARFGTLVTAMVTPFDAAGELDLDAAATLARWLVDHGTEGIVVTGSTGEGSVLSDAEKRDLWRAVAEAVTVPVIAGAGTNDTRHSIDLVASAAAAGVDALLLVTPYYNRPSQSGIYEHFSAVAASTGLPVMLYNIPVRTGRLIAPGTIKRLATDVPNIVAVKDSTGDPAGAARLRAVAPSSLQVYCGDDALTLPFMSVGAVGLVSVASHWAGREIREMITAFESGDVGGAAHMNTRLVESYGFESSDEFPNPLPAKAACRIQGLAVGQCRLPLGASPPELEGEARRVIERLAVPAAYGGGGG